MQNDVVGIEKEAHRSSRDRLEQKNEAKIKPNKVFEIPSSTPAIRHFRVGIARNSDNEISSKSNISPQRF